MTEIKYMAGVCNIGPEEIKRRRNIGWLGLVITLVLLAILVATGVNHWWRLFMFFPVTLSASGFIQAAFGFCTGFASKGVYNFGPTGGMEKVGDEASKQKDKRKGTLLTLYAVCIGIVVTLLAVI